MTVNKRISAYFVFIRDLVFEAQKTIVDNYKERRFGTTKFFYSFVMISAILIFLANIIKHCLIMEDFNVNGMIKDIVFEPAVYIAAYYLSYYLLRFFYDKFIPNKIDNEQLNYMLIPIFSVFMLVKVLLCFLVNMWFLNLFFILAVPILWIFSQGVLNLENKIKYYLVVSSIVTILSMTLIKMVLSIIAPNF